VKRMRLKYSFKNVNDHQEHKNTQKIAVGTAVVQFVGRSIRTVAPHEVADKCQGKNPCKYPVSGSNVVHGVICSKIQLK
jgi:hypothetical protein